MFHWLGMSTKVGWRNIRRNGGRSTVTGIAIALNAAILAMIFGLVDGFEEQTIRNITRVIVGDAQAHHQAYLGDRSMYKALAKPQAVLAAADAMHVRSAPRAFGYGLVSADTKSAGAVFWGLKPEAETAAFDLHRKMWRGEFLAPTASGTVIVGRKLARQLNVDVGSELVAVVQAADGSMGNELYTVQGILKNVNENIDRGGIMLHREDFETLFVAAGRVHEIAFTGLASDEQVAKLAGAVAALDPTQQVQDWRKLMPLMSDMLNLNDASTWLVAAVFMLAAALSVLNTMLMATHARVREYGMLKALGQGGWRIVLDVVVEAALLGGVAVVLGAALGLLGTWLLATYGIDLSAAQGVSFGGVSLDPIWRAAFRWANIGQSCVSVWLVAVGASLYPALRVAMLEPIAAMNEV